MKTINTASAAAVALATVAALVQGTGAQAPTGTSASSVTFTRDVAPILQRSCQNCHRPDSMAPMSFLTYEDVRPWVRAIRQKVTAREMPPWYIDRTVGISKFKDDPSLSDKEIQTIVAWVDSGAVKGNPADMPQPRHFEDDNIWHIGKPDLVVKSIKHTVPATGSDWWGDYVVDTGLTEDRYLKAVETKPSPGSKKVVHHAVTFLLQDEGDSDLVGRGATRSGGGGGEIGGFLNEYAVGKNGDIFPDDTGRLVKAGAKIRFNMHYHPVGEETVDQSEVALVFYPKDVKPKYYIQASHTGDFEDLDLPPGVDNIRSDGYTRLAKNARITSFQPHLHNRGKAQCIEAIYPDGKVEQLNCVNNYKFGWHIVYNYTDDVQPLLPAGTMLHVISWHNNTSSNRYNPDPRNWVGFGQRSIDDMSFAWVNYIWLTDEDFKAQQDARKAAKERVTSSSQENR
jgi:mono/diheme cytochrome c family protein